MSYFSQRDLSFLSRRSKIKAARSLHQAGQCVSQLPAAEQNWQLPPTRWLPPSKRRAACDTPHTGQKKEERDTKNYFTGSHSAHERCRWGKSCSTPHGSVFYWHYPQLTPRSIPAPSGILTTIVKDGVKFCTWEHLPNIANSVIRQTQILGCSGTQTCLKFKLPLSAIGAYKKNTQRSLLPAACRAEIPAWLWGFSLSTSLHIN